ncbi:hypothetical protein AK830_g3939 [Neonectria ditissima]|uniref:Repetitive proline-rich cell wall protein n=1 Tax=Neonectria ditissima TaxID=78410 RepID=A0A0P7BPG8_9HYPO|nr:hypothetical protein AK830_g3939 [Neonectria ditissima]
MKFSAPLLLLASSALANQVQPRGDEYDEGDYGYGETTTLTTYTTVTTCPVTSTYTKEGSTYCVTELTTSTIVVTECHGCGVTTVQGPDVTKTGVDVEYTTRTTVCPVTETKTVGGEEVTVVYTTTSTIVEVDHSTAYDTVKQPDTTKVEYDTAYTTRTTLCPVTETKTVAGEVVTVVYTETSTIVENGHTTYYETDQLPDTTKVEYDTEYTTRTTLCPVTVTTVIEGETVTKVYTETSTIVENGHTTYYETDKLPDTTKVEYDTEYTTRTTLCPVTVTTVVEGETITKVYTETSTIVENGHTTYYETAHQPDTTKVEYDTAYTTRTTLCPVTVTTVIEGETITKVYTETSTIVENGYETYVETEKQPDTTEVEHDTAYITRTSLCPVTITTVIEGETVTEVYTEISTIVEHAYETEYDTVKQPDVTATGVETQYITRTTLCPITETKTVAGEEVTVVYTETSTIVEKGYQTLYDTVKQPDVTKTGLEVQYITSVSLCPVTETKTVNGETFTKIYTSTQYLVSQVTTTLDEYKTIYETATGVEVETQYSKVLVTVGGGTVVETLVPETTVQIPQTEVITKPVVTVTSQPPATPTSAPAELPTGAAAANQPAFALMAGLVGALALL